jgi:hypothetical protein
VLLAMEILVIPISSTASASSMLSEFIVAITYCCTVIDMV